MQQRQLRLGDVLDDYCPRERRLTNHAIVAMVGQDVKQTRCTTCDSEHAYKQAKVPRQRKRTDTQSALYSSVLAGAPKKVVHEAAATIAEAPPRTASADNEPGTPDRNDDRPNASVEDSVAGDDGVTTAGSLAEPAEEFEGEPPEPPDAEEGPVHRPLIRAQLPRPEGQPPSSRPAPEFTIRQPGGRQRFRPRNQRGGQFQGQGHRPNGPFTGGFSRGGVQRPGGRPMEVPGARASKRHGSGRKRSK